MKAGWTSHLATITNLRVAVVVLCVLKGLAMEEPLRARSSPVISINHQASSSSDGPRIIKSNHCSWGGWGWVYGFTGGHQQIPRTLPWSLAEAQLPSGCLAAPAPGRDTIAGSATRSSPPAAWDDLSLKPGTVSRANSQVDPSRFYFKRMKKIGKKALN